MTRTMIAVVLAGVVVCGAASAWAHGGQPIPRAIYTDPLQDDLRALISSDLGLHISTDAGATWYWLCEDVVGFDVQAFALAGPPADDPRQRVWLAGGVGLGQGELAGEFVPGLYRSTDGGCNWSPVAGDVDQQWTAALSVNPDNPNEVVVATRHINLDNGLAISEDAGATWRWSSVKDEPRYFTTLVRAPGNPQVLYAANAAYLLRSLDGGRTWETFYEDLPEDPADELTVLAVDPEDPELLYFGLLGFQGRHLYATADGGRTAPVKILEPSGLDFRAMTLLVTDDQGGRELLVGDTFGTAFRSIDGGQTWEEYLAGASSIECLAPVPDTTDQLFVCSNPFVQFVPPVYSLGISADSARTVDPVFAYAETEDYLQCPEGSQIDTVCKALMEVGPDAGNEDAGMDDFDAGDGDPDAGVEPDVPEGDGGGTGGGGGGKGGDCDCATPSRPSHGQPLWPLVGLLALIPALRRRRRAAVR